MNGHAPLLELDGKPIRGSHRCQGCGLNESYWSEACTHPIKIVTVFIDEDGMQFLMTESIKLFEGEGEVRRASHVEPDGFVFRIAFHALRNFFGDKGRMSEFTRSWPCLWRVNTKPTAGVILPGRWRDRQQAIDAEIVFLNEWFAGEHR